ncbi:uncharacterized protein LOC105177769 isoform X2 [Sesamum indicum]|uniref:Uncharacterized protein LOC105177769 isoform X2 n=1 Tax=Sesamum indicum TaxID=4182 RepID=A0A6I9UDR2_SESIN|nr:uncharacterized protein LOC105177769 isoform X2 [Sesamum indicum]
MSPIVLYFPGPQPNSRTLRTLHRFIQPHSQSHRTHTEEDCQPNTYFTNSENIVTATAAMTAGQPTVNKPSRSDDVLDAAQQLQIYNQVRAHFDSVAPKRPIKPNRSEPDSVSSSISSPDEDIHVPELDKLRSLQYQSQAIVSQSTALEQEEFVETQYYKALDSIDKQHHTTGTGFIKTVDDHKSGDGYDLQLDGRPENEGKYKEMVCKTNPATNDWIPKFDDYQIWLIGKCLV